jgi:hypothetical protein
VGEEELGARRARLPESIQSDELGGWLSVYRRLDRPLSEGAVL